MTLRLSLNGETVETAARTLADLLAERGMAAAKCATAVNEDFVPAALRPDTPLRAGDRVEIVTPRQGG